MPEEIKCVLCGDAPSRVIFRILPRAPYRNDIVMGPQRECVWRLCGGCGLIYLSPRLTVEEASSLYDEAYHDRHHEELRGWEFKKKADLIEKCVKGGRLLDVGCGYGYFQKALGSHWQATGIDMSPHAAEFGRESLGVDVRCSTFAGLGAEAGSFDAGTLWDVVEHVQDPVADLRLAHRALRRGGALGLSTGLISALVPRVAGKYWYFLNIPDHQFAFTMKWLRSALDVIGFDVRDVVIHNKGFDFLPSFMKRFAVEAAKWSLGALWGVTRSGAVERRLKDKAPPLAPMFNDIVMIAAVKR